MTRTGSLLARLLRIALAAALVALAACVTEPADDTAEPAHERGETLLARGVRAYAAGNYSAATADFTNALHYYRRYDLATGMVRSRINLARIELDLGHAEAAQARARAADALRSRLDAPELRARLDLVTSSVALELGDTERARATIEAHLPAFDDAQAPVVDTDGPGLDGTRASLIANRAAAAFARDDGERELWLERLAQSLQAMEGEPAPGLRAHLERLRARQARAHGSAEAAVAHLERALAAAKRARSEPAIAATLELTAAVHAEQGRSGQAVRYLDRALYNHIARRDRRGARVNLRQRLPLAASAPTHASPDTLETWLDQLDKKSVDWAGLRTSVIGDTEGR